MNILKIDTRDSKNIIIRLETDKKVFKEKTFVDRNKTQSTLPAVEKLLKQAGIGVQDIREIKVENVGGSFTGLRVGVAIANALSFSLGVKVNDKNLGEIESPQY
ncbi:MAG TPA: hypothetical protein VG917_02525 [Patescibacteria group bacterium]|nr:hypothetical protein [Patescibacteria group bacterium]